MTAPQTPPGRVDARRPLRAPLAAAFCLLLAACGGGSSDEAVVPQSDGSFEVLSGRAEKGPLLRGSMVTVNTLTPAPVALAAGTTTALPNTTPYTLPALVPSGSTFTLEVKDDFGGFSPQSAAIFQSAFVETTAQGYYLNELNGQRSSDFLTLRGLSNLKSDRAINVNLLTDLTRERTLALARRAAGSAAVTSAQFNAARSQAQEEALKAFNLRASDLGGVTTFAELDLKRLSSDATARAADQILLALSALALQVGQDGAGLQDFLSRFEEDLAGNGVIDSTDLKARIAEAAVQVDFAAVAAHMNRVYGSGRFNGDALAQWVDRSGGSVGLIGRDVQYPAGLVFTPGATLDSRTYTVAASAAVGCYGVEMNDSRYGSASLVSGTAVVASGQLLPVNSTAAALKIRFTPGDLNAVAYLVRWQPVSGACSLANQTGKVRLLAYAAASPDVARFFNRQAGQFQACFNLPVNQRVLAVDNSVPSSEGRPTVTQMAPACAALFSRASDNGTEFLQNGFSAGQAFHGMLHDGALTRSVRITRVDLLRYIESASAPLAPRPTLVAQVRYADRYGREGSFTQVAQRIAGTSPATAGWWNVGNQQPVDINVKPLLRQFNSMAAYDTATPSLKQHYRSGIGFFIAANGPGTRLPDGSPLTAVRVSGGGISGLVYVPPVQAGQTWMDISNQNGDVGAAGARRCGATVPSTGPVYRNCPYLWFNRSTSVQPSTAAPVLRVPTLNEGSCASATSVTQTCAWGGTWAPTDLTGSLQPGAPITLELFYGGRTTPELTYQKTMVFPIVPLAQAHQQGWPVLSAASLVAARPQAGQTSLALNWTGEVANRVEVGSATVTLANAGGTVATPDEPVLRGSSMVLLQPGEELQWQPVGTATTQRALLLNLRSWSGSSRSVWTSFDTAN